MNNTLKTLSCRYTERWLEIRHLKNSDENFDGEIAYQIILKQRIILFASGFLTLVLYYSATSLVYGESLVALVLITVLLMWYANLRDTCYESEELRQLREEWQEKRRLLKSVKRINTGYSVDIMRKFESEIGRLHAEYLLEKSRKRDMKYQFAIKGKAKELHDLAKYCGLPVRSFGELFS